MGDLEPGYSSVAKEQLDQIGSSGDLALYHDLVTICEEILDHTGRARVRSAAVRTEGGAIVFRYAVPGRAPFKVSWTSDGPTVLVVFPYPT